MMISQEFVWRSGAAAVWTWVANCCCVFAFLFIWGISPSNHIYALYDYVLLLFSFRAWIIVFCISCLSSIYIKLHMQCYKVTCRLPTTRFQSFVETFKIRQTFNTLCHGTLGGVIVAFLSGISQSRFSSIYLQCTSDPSLMCLNEWCHILILFGAVVGAVNYISKSNNQLYCLKFPTVHQARFLSIKCNLAQIVMQSCKLSARILQYFLIFYYIVGFVTRGFVAELLRANESEGDVMSIFNVMEILMLGWTLWLSGSILLLLHKISWHLFNVYVTKMYPFPIDSIFPEDKVILLTSNLGSNQPILVQHLAFQYLSDVASSSANKRKQIFSIFHESGATNQTKWNIILDECLSRLNQLIINIKEHKLAVASSSDPKTNTTSSKKTSSSSQSSSCQSPLPDSSQFLSASVFNPGLQPGNSNDSPNISCFDVSSLNTSRQITSPTLNGPSITVPTPKLWTRQIRKRAALHSNTPNVPSASMSIAQAPYQEVSQITYKSFNNQLQSLLQRLLSSTKKIPVVSYFFNKIPSHTMANLYTDHNIHRWAIRSLASLSAASLAEDDYGVVQRRLHQVLNVLLDLLITLEKNGKVFPSLSSAAAGKMLREQQSIKCETISAIYRITDTFSNQLESIPVDAEFRRKLRSFVDHQE